MICVDNLETGSLANIEHLRSEAFSFVHVDIPGFAEWVRRTATGEHEPGP